MLYPSCSILVKLGHFTDLFNSNSWVLIIYLSFWTFLYSDFLISSLFLHPLTSFQFWSQGCRYTLSLLRRICLIFSIALTLSAFLGVSILEFWHHLLLVFSTTTITLYIQDLLSLSAFLSSESDIYIYLHLLGFYFLWHNVFPDRSHISQRGENVIT